MLQGKFALKFYEDDQKGKREMDLSMLPQAVDKQVTTDEFLMGFCPI